MKTLSRLLICLLTITSVARAQDDAIKQMEPAASKWPSDWPPKGFVAIVGYCMDDTQDPRGIDPVLPDRSLNKGIIRSTTVRLSTEQSKLLLELITKPAGEFQEEQDCYYPHHAFVFYDAAWKPVGWFAVSFECSTYTASTKAVPENLVVADIRKFCEKIGMPTPLFTKDYISLFIQEQPREERKKLEDAARKRLEEYPEYEQFKPDKSLQR
jgi:hypothetical protein